MVRSIRRRPDPPSGKKGGTMTKGKGKYFSGEASAPWGKGWSAAKGFGLFSKDVIGLHPSWDDDEEESSDDEDGEDADEEDGADIEIVPELRALHELLREAPPA